MRQKQVNEQQTFLPRVLRQLYRHLGAILSTVLIVFLLKTLFPRLEVQTIALLFLIPIMVSTALWGLTPGILASLLSFLGFNYFFIPPYNSFKVHQTSDLISLIIFLVVAAVLSQLIGRAREGMKLAKEREWDATRMYELSSALSAVVEPSDALKEMVGFLYTTFDLSCVQAILNDPDTSENYQVIVPPGTPPSGKPDIVKELLSRGFLQVTIRIWEGIDPLRQNELSLVDTTCLQVAHVLEKILFEQQETRLEVLEQSNQLKSALLNSVSHDLRTPLTAIKASASSLHSGAVNWNSPEGAELLATIEEETDHLNLLVGNLLDMSRIESGALKLNLQLNSIAEIANASVAKVKSQLTRHQVLLDFPGDLPLVNTDFILMGQVFINLLSNSAKYSPIGSVIRINTSVEDGNLITRVCNKSPRLPEDQLGRIFEKFHRITDADKTSGTGLGLSICKGIVEAHGGSILAGNLADGFMFSFSLPLPSTMISVEEESN